jgi:hypothetical protein
MKIKIDIKSVFGNVLFSFEKENNTIKDTLEEANLRGADYSEYTSFLAYQCPIEGSFIGWKKCGRYIVYVTINFEKYE